MEKQHMLDRKLEAHKKDSFFYRNKLSIGVVGVFFILMLLFIIANPAVFLSYRAYISVFTIVGPSIILATTSVFIIASGELDLSFPSVIGISAYVFSLTAKNGVNPYLGMLLALVAGVCIGMVNGLMVTKIHLSSLVVTLGMNFLLRGLIMIFTDGLSIPLPFLRGTAFRDLFVGRIGQFPVQMIWSIGYALFLWLLFNRHKFGGYVCYVGDNLTSAKEMGIKVDQVKIGAFVLMGFSSAFAGILMTLVNNAFWPTTGDGYLLLVLAAVFLGGTPTWGGIGTIFGAIIGSLIIGFIETGIVASGLIGFYKQFFYGLIIILALISHRFAGLRKD